MKSVEDIQQEVRQIGLQLCGNLKPPWLFSVAISPQRDGYPHIEVVGDEYHFVVTARGSELERKITKEVDELLFWLVEGDVLELACEWELNHRVPTQDTKRLIASKEIEYLDKINPKWAERKRKQIGNALMDNLW